MKPRFVLSGRHLPVLLLVCLGVFVSLLSFISLRSFEADKARAAFERVAQERFDDLQSDLDLSVSKVVATGAFCESSYPISRSSFTNFVSPLLSGHDGGIESIEWVPQVKQAERAAFEKSARRNGQAGFEIRDNLDGKMVRAGDRAVYFPVRYVLPATGADLFDGFDNYAASPARREAFLSAASTGELTLTQRIVLVRGPADRNGILILRPAFGVRAGKRKLLGFAVGVLRLRDVVEQHGAKSGVELSVTDTGASPAEQQLYPSVGAAPLPDSSFTQVRTISVGGRTWQLTASPMPGAFSVTKTYSYGAGVLCLTITFLIGAYVVDMLDRSWQVERVVDERTRDLNAALRSLAEVHRGLEESERRYRRVVEDSPVAILVERERKIVLVNRAAVEVFGFDSAQEFEGYNIEDFVIPERRDQAKETLKELYLRDTRIGSRETRGVRRDGVIVDMEVSASSFLDAGLRTVQVTLRDITQRKQGEAENARLISAIEQVGESIVITDRDARIVYVNPAFERISGYTREEVLGRNPRILNGKRHSGAFYADLWNSLLEGESWTGRFYNRTKAGRLFTEDASISPVSNRNGEIINFVAVKRDVTLEIELQEQLHQSQKMDAIGRLAGGVAHDFNNMLMVIISYAELIADSLPDEDPLRQHVDQILRAAKRSSALTRQLLTFSRKQVLTPRVLDCNTIISETSSMVRRLISENIELKCELEPELWPVMADADQIVQVVLNLCVNSRDAMPNGGTLVLATRNYHVDLGFVEITVSDTGVGIPRELQEKLFEPFFTTKERGKGTGLGLATVYGIIQQSGGQIRVESSLGQGTTFIIHLPRCLESVLSPETPIRKPVSQGRSAILVVEDEDALRDAITRHLREEGYRVHVASDGIEALTIISVNPDISIIVADLIMPRMGGQELAQSALKSIPNLRVIFMSGYADQAQNNSEGVGGASVLLQKPFTINSLLAHIADFESLGESTE